MSTIAQLDVNLGMNVGAFVSSAGKARGAMTDLGQIAERVYEETRTAAERYEVKLSQISGLYKRGQIDADTYGRAVARLKDELDRAANSERELTGLAKLRNLAASGAGALGIGLGAGAAVSEVAHFVESSVAAYREAQLEQQKLTSSLESTGHAAGFTKAQLNAYASEQQQLTNYDDDAIAGAQAVLATFTKIKGLQFTETTKAILNLSAKMRQDLQSSAVQLGKALNDPIRGLTALRRVGVSFTAEQQELIKSLVQTGDLAGAQNEVLKEMGTEFGRTAELMRNELTVLSNNWGDLKEAVGSFSDTKGGTSALRALSTEVRAITADVSNLIETLNAAPSAGDFAEGLSTLLHLGTRFGAARFLVGDAFAPPKQQPEETAATTAAARAAENAEAAKSAKALDQAVTKLTADLVRQVETFGKSAAAAGILTLETRGATAADLAGARAAAAKLETLKQGAAAAKAAAKATDEAAKAAAGLAKQEGDLVASLKEQIVTFGMSANMAKIYHLTMASGKFQQEALALAAQLEGLEKQKKAQEELAKAAAKTKEALADAAKQVFEQTRKPLEKAVAEYERLTDLLVKGKIDKETFERATAAARKELSAGEHDQKPAALVRGSAAAFSAANRLGPQQSEATRSRRALMKAAAATEKHTAAIARAAKKNAQPKVIANFN